MHFNDEALLGGQKHSFRLDDSVALHYLCCSVLSIFLATQIAACRYGDGHSMTMKNELNHYYQHSALIKQIPSERLASVQQQLIAPSYQQARECDEVIK